MISFVKNYILQNLLYLEPAVSDHTDTSLLNTIQHMNSSSYFGVYVDVTDCSTLCLPPEDATPGIHTVSSVLYLTNV